MCSHAGQVGSTKRSIDIHMHSTARYQVNAPCAGTLHIDAVLHALPHTHAESLCLQHRFAAYILFVTLSLHWQVSQEGFWVGPG